MKDNHYYLSLYERFILSRSKREIKDNVIEIHHIKPKCIGGDDSSENLIPLTPREHLLAHLILSKAYPLHIGLKKALQAMFKGCKHQQQTRNFNSRFYTLVRNSLYVKIPSEEELKELYFVNNMSYSKIGKLFNVSDMTVYKWFKIYNIHPKKSSDYLFVVPSKEALIEQIKNDTYPYKNTCNFFKVSKSLLYKWLKKYELVSYRWGDNYPKDAPPLEDIKKCFSYNKNQKTSKHHTIRKVKETYGIGMDRARQWVNSYNLF